MYIVATLHLAIVPQSPANAVGDVICTAYRCQNKPTHNRICGIRSNLIISFIKNNAHIQFHTQYGCEKNTSAEMATLTRSKSPRPGQSGGKQPDKEESFWDKIGTLGRKKRIKEGMGHLLL